MRILVGTTEIGGQIPVLGDAFRRCGCAVTTVVRQKNPFFDHLSYDVRLGEYWAIPWPAAIAASRSPWIRFPRGVINRLFLWLQGLIRLPWLAWRVGRLIWQHDVFVFQAPPHSLLRHNREFWLIKLLGKRIVSIFVGSDVREPDAYKQWYRGAHSFLQHQSFPPNPLLRALRRLRRAERYSDVILSQPNQSVLAVRPYYHVFVPLDLALYPFRIPARDVPVVVHAPSRAWLKGTDLIHRALTELARAGVRFELQLLQGLRNDRLVERLADADVVIDELYFPHHGKLALEAMACGCAVANGDREDYEPYPPARPIWHINPTKLQSQLHRLLTDKELRISLAEAGRRYVERHFDHVHVAQRILTALKSPTELPPDHYPAFFATEYRLPAGRRLPRSLQRWNARLMNRHGLPAAANVAVLIDRGLIPASARQSLQQTHRWREIPARTPNLVSA